MTTTDAPRATALPPQAWALGWACLAGQVFLVADRGLDQSNDAIFVLLSMTLGAALVGWFSAGVLTGRPVRTFVAAILLGLAPLLYLLALLDGMGDDWVPVHLATSVVELAALVAFVRTPYFREQRAQVRPAGPPLGSVLVLALLVGALGGMVQDAGPSDAGVQLQLGL